jgi:hypothetical protein
MRLALFALGAALAVAYSAYVWRAHRQGRLNFRGRVADVNTTIGLADITETAGGCLAVVGAIIGVLIGLFALIWLIKRMWELA